MGKFVVMLLIAKGGSSLGPWLEMGCHWTTEVRQATRAVTLLRKISSLQSMWLVRCTVCGCA